MTMRRTAILVVLMPLLLFSCRKEEGVSLEIFAEQFGGDAKLTVDGKYADWDDGDTIRINATTATVSRQSGHAYISNVVASSVNRAVFPSSLCGPIASDEVTITLPSEYTYRSSAAGQVLEMPMAAASAAESPLHFKHLTGALQVTVKGDTMPLTIEKIVVSSNRYQLNGNRTLDFGNIEAQTAAPAANEAQKSVAMLFDDVVIGASDSVNVVIPIAPVDSNNIFTITIVTRSRGTRYRYQRTQSRGGALARNVMAYAVATATDAAHVTKENLFQGQGTPGVPFQLSSAADFRLMLDAFEGGWKLKSGSKSYKECSYKLTDSIDLAGDAISPISISANWQLFNGNGFAIKNFTINSTEESSIYSCALFKTLGTGATLSNLIVSDVTLRHSGTATQLDLSPLCARPVKCTINNCTVRNVDVELSGNITTINYGGIMANLGDSTIISGCRVKGPVEIPEFTGTLHYGGIIGNMYKADSLSDCPSAIISGCVVENGGLVARAKTVFAGGFIGYIIYVVTSLSSSSYSGDMNIATTSYTNAGGMIGYCNTTSISVTYTGNTAEGSITATTGTGTSRLGRLIGRVVGASPTNSGSTSTVTLMLNGTAVNKDIGSD